MYMLCCGYIAGSRRYFTTLVCPGRRARYWREPAIIWWCLQGTNRRTPYGRKTKNRLYPLKNTAILHTAEQIFHILWRHRDRQTEYRIRQYRPKGTSANCSTAGCLPPYFGGTGNHRRLTAEKRKPPAAEKVPPNCKNTAPPVSAHKKNVPDECPAILYGRFDSVISPAQKQFCGASPHAGVGDGALPFNFF